MPLRFQAEAQDAEQNKKRSMRNELASDVGNSVTFWGKRKTKTSYLLA